MSMSFKRAVQAEANKPNTGMSRTENGMATYSSSLDHAVDLFFKIGASRGKSVDALFAKAYYENPEVAIRIMLWARDIRGGAGERQIFRDLLQYVETTAPEYLYKIIDVTPEIGRWDDLLHFKTADAKMYAYGKIKSALNNADGLCAKWMPRKGKNAMELRKVFGWSPKFYRKTLVNLTKVVETQMCSKDWENINFSHVPSVAASRYQHAFSRNAETAYSKYRDALAANDGSAKVNAGAVYPYDVLKPMTSGYSYKTPANPEVIKAQWEAMPNYLGDESILPMIDVSGSMGCAAAGSLTCMNVAVSLGLYLADKSSGAFKDMFLTFSDTPMINVLEGDIIAKTKSVMASNWGYNTNLHAAFKKVLNVAQNRNLSEDDMPKYILVLSDMEFDACAKFDDRAMQMIERKYEDSGFKTPKIVFWNINSHSDGNAPVRFNKEGVALVSGFSPSIMKGILKANVFTPKDIMLGTVNVDRYDIFS